MIRATQQEDDERDMSMNQRGLVDTCFEEGQYESAAIVLDQLRSPQYKPHPPHIRHLVYIALYPAPETDPLSTEKIGDAPVSPSKLLSRQQRSTLLPTRKATDAALDLLFAFAQTNSPGALFAALPKYVQAGEHVNVIQEDADSFIARQSVRIRNAKDCWCILREGFVQPSSDPPLPTRRKGSARGRRGREDPPEYKEEDTHGATSLAPVGENAWPVLDWILCLLENDEELVEKSSEPRHSPLLLSQIPPPRSAMSARWDIEAPFDVVFHCHKEQDLRRRSMGIRLLTLLVNLSATMLIDLPLFLNAVGSRLFSLPADEVTSLLGALPPSSAVLHFKLLLCKNYLTSYSSGSRSGQSSDRSRPQAKAQPRPVPARRRQVAKGPSLTDAGNPVRGPSTTAGAVPASIARKYPVIPASEVLALIESPCSADAPAIALGLRVRLELALAYWSLQKQSPDQSVDAEWEAALSDGGLQRAFDAACAPVLTRKISGTLDTQAIRGMRRLLAAISI